MIRKEAWVLLLVLVVLVGLGWYLKQPDSLIKATPTTVPTISTMRYLLETESSAVSGFRLSSQAGAAVSLQRGPGGIWIVKEPIEGIANQGQGEEAASQLTSLRILTTLDSAPPASATGLDVPGYTLAVTTTDGKTITVKVGKVTVTNTGYYVEDEAGTVQVINKTNFDSLSALISNPPYAETPTPSPEPSATPLPTATLEPTGTSKP